MLKRLLKNIKEDLKVKIVECEQDPEFDPEEPLFVHFGVGMYIRNKYLWHNEKNIKVLGKYYGTQEVDEISNKLWKEFWAEYKKED